MKNEEKIVSVDRAQLNHTPALMYSIISDITTYPSWWKGAQFNSFINNEGKTVLEVSPKKGPGNFIWKIEEVVEDQKVVLSYDGIFTGTGVWQLLKTGATTKVSYTVDLDVKHGFYKFINKFFSLEKMHSKMMEEVFRSLDQHLNNLHRKRSV